MRRRAAAPPRDLAASVLAAWRTNARVTLQLVRGLPRPLWDVGLPGNEKKTVRALAAHLHNSRCGWIRTLGKEHGLVAPGRVDPRRVTPRELVAALKKSGAAMEALLELGLSSGGEVPPSKGYVWRNLSLDVGHVLTYFVGHEAHHRGQLVLAARAAGRPLPAAARNALWWWRRDR